MKKRKNAIKFVFPLISLIGITGFAGCDTGSSGREISSLPLTMVSVPSGSFQRDSTSTNISTVSAFYMSEKEITRAQFKEIMGTDPSDSSYSSGTRDPVQYVSWYGAIAFCNKLSLTEGLTAVYTVSTVSDWENLAYRDIPTANDDNWNGATQEMSATGYRLPTEMEWMWAAMGATSNSTATWSGDVDTKGYDKVFAGSTGSNSIGDCAVFGYYYTSQEGHTTTLGTSPVGSRDANEIGLYDMSGNVFEWCWDWYEDWPSGTKDDYTGPSSEEARVRKGGCWNSSNTQCSLDSRAGNSPADGSTGRGFRVVRR